MSKLSKTAQTYIGIVSVFMLVLVGSGTYLLQNNQTSVNADIAKNTIVETPELSLETSSQNATKGDRVKVDLSGQFMQSPISGATISISYPVDLLKPSSQNFTDGILENPTKNEIDEDLGVISLEFAPIAGSAASGKIAELNFDTLASGQADVTIADSDLTSANNNIVDTQVTNTAINIQ